MATHDLTASIPTQSQLAQGDIINCPYSGSAKSITLPKGTYKLECWGAQGGSRGTNSGAGGKGGYSTGILTLTADTILYLSAGGQGVSSTTSTTGDSAGWNGGGGAQYYGGGGGGASDVRIGQDSLYARVIVAGGGGGAQGRNSSTYAANGGAGGGTSGQYGGYMGTQPSGTNTVTNGGPPGTATSAGTAVNTTYGNTSGSFGIGGNGGLNSTTTCGTGAGGGGWYGGGTGQYRYSGGGGGSGYVYTSSTASQYPSGCQLNSSYYLTSASTILGINSFTAPNGTSETGHAGAGYVRITILDMGPSISKMMLKINSNTWKAFLE